MAFWILAREEDEVRMCVQENRESAKGEHEVVNTSVIRKKEAKCIYIYTNMYIYTSAVKAHIYVYL